MAKRQCSSSRNKKRLPREAHQHVFFNSIKYVGMLGALLFATVSLLSLAPTEINTAFASVQLPDRTVMEVDIHFGLMGEGDTDIFDGLALGEEYANLYAIQTEDVRKYWLKKAQEYSANRDWLWVQDGELIAINPMREYDIAEYQHAYQNEKVFCVLETRDGFAKDHNLRLGEKLQIPDVLECMGHGRIN